jgi:hypothetical protein
MNKLYISIIALATLSGAAYASDSGDVRDSDTCMGKYCRNVKTPFTSPTATKVSPLAIEDNARSLTAFERMNKISQENENSSH